MFEVKTLVQRCVLFSVSLVGIFFLALFLRSVSRPSHEGGVGTPCVFSCDPQSLLVCKAGACDHCITDTDCSLERRNTVCNEKKQCVHQPIFPPSWDVVCTILLAMVTVAIASGGGIGGGGILVAILILVSGFTAHTAVPLSNATIFGGAIYNFIYFFYMRHPSANRPRIDYNIAILIEPLSLAGSTLGILLNHIFPEYLILLLLIVVLGFTAYRTTLKGMEIWALESGASKGEEEPLLTAYSVVPATTEPLSSKDEAELKELLESESEHIPWRVSILAAPWLLVFLSQYLRGNVQSSLIHCGSTAYWFLFFLVFPIAIVISLYFGDYLVLMHEKKVTLKYPFQPGDILWTSRTSRLYPAMCSVAGVVAGTLGVSGGIIKGPLLLEWNVLPQVQAATTSFMVLSTSSSTVAQFILFGKLDLEYAFVFAVAGFFAAVVGQNGIAYLIKKFKKTAFIAFSLAIILAVSTVLIAYVGYADVSTRHVKSASVFQFRAPYG